MRVTPCMLSSILFPSFSKELKVFNPLTSYGLFVKHFFVNLFILKSTILLSTTSGKENYYLSSLHKYREFFFLFF